jgi:hypothetical protein
MAVANQDKASSQHFVHFRVLSSFVILYGFDSLRSSLHRHSAILRNTSRPLPCGLGRFLLETHSGPRSSFFFPDLIFLARCFVSVLILGRGALCCIGLGVGECPRIRAARVASRGYWIER